MKNFTSLVLILLISLLVSSQNEETNLLVKYKLLDIQNAEEEFCEEVITTEEDTFEVSVLESNVTKLDKNILQFTKSVTNFLMESVELEEIEPETFDSRNILDLISLRNNSLTTIRSGTFKNLQITVLDLSSNKITHLEKRAIVNMSKLLSLNLAQNEILVFQGNALDITPNLFILYLSFNNLSNLGRKSLSFINKRKSISLFADHNEIEDIHPQAFSGVKMDYLTLAFNNLQSIPGLVFKRASFAELHLENNQLRALPKTFFKPRLLKYINIQNNPLKCGMQKNLIRFTRKNGITLRYSKECF